LHTRPFLNSLEMPMTLSTSSCILAAVRHRVHVEYGTADVELAARLRK
jgi:hypothetical protein